MCTKFGTVIHIGSPEGMAVKIFNLLKSKMADGLHFEKSKNGHMSATT